MLMLAATAWFSCALFIAALSAELPEGFIHLSEIDPSIVQDIRYYSPHNFVGRRIEGYNAPECILARAAALALSKVQAALAKKGLSLIAWDCYRPERAVADFVAWSKNPSETGRKAEFFPNLDKRSLFAFGYIAAHSAHSRGSTVDLGLIAKGASPQRFEPAASPVSCAAPKSERYQDGALDFGAGFDCLDRASNLGAAGLTAEARKNRAMLRKAMIAGGFAPYDKEWWHFTLRNEPFAGKSFDFPVEPKNGEPASNKTSK